jgi:GDP-L-fucose synthase
MSRILITGGESMIGMHLRRILQQTEHKLYPIVHSECDLLDINQLRPIFHGFRPEFVFHLATYSGNIDFNQKYPADTYYRTAQIGLNVLKLCADFKTTKVINVLSSCSIADKKDKVLEESDLWEGLPNSTIECHGLAKRTLHAYSRQLNKQFNLNSICCIVNNSFGEFDSFAIHRTKVVGAMIKRFVDAKENKLDKVVCWGDGSPLRELIYAHDVARLLILSVNNYNDSINPINVGTPNEISIKDLATTIAEVVGYNGTIEWDTTKPNGQMRKKLDLTRMNKILLKSEDFIYTPFKEAIQNTVQWYIDNRKTWLK